MGKQKNVVTMDFSERAEKARHLEQYGQYKVEATDTHNRPTMVLVSGSGLKLYKIALTRKHDGIVCECQLVDGKSNPICAGSSHGFCYHMMVALYASVKISDKSIVMCETEIDAKRVSRFGADGWLKAVAQPSGREVWVVYHSDEHIIQPKTDDEARISNIVNYATSQLPPPPASASARVNKQQVAKDIADLWGSK